MEGIGAMPKGETRNSKALNLKAANASMVLLTGPSGSGKSTLAKSLERRGWQRLDGDALAKSLYVPGSPLLRSIAKEFGATILKSDASLDTHRLGEIVFPSVKKRIALKRLVYKPFLRALRSRMRTALLDARPCVAEVAVYFDLGAPRLNAPVVLVQAPLRTRVARLRAEGLSAKRAGARARALRFGRQERLRADLVLDGRKALPLLLRDFDRGLKALGNGRGPSVKVRR
jgi:dephospho-CoA kinase